MALETNIQTVLIAEIKAMLESVSEIKEVKAHGYTRIEKYPAIIFTPDSFENSFLSTTENEETYKFKIWIIIGATQSTLDNIYERILPNAIDAVKEKINNAWSGGTIDGHRIWYQLDSGRPGLSEEAKGLQAWGELSLTVKLATNN